MVYFAKVPEIAHVVRRTATKRAEAALIITFFFIILISFLNWLKATFLFLPFREDSFYRAFKKNYPPAENTAVLYINPGTWLPWEEYTTYPMIHRFLHRLMQFLFLRLFRLFLLSAPQARQAKRQCRIYFSFHTHGGE